MSISDYTLLLKTKNRNQAHIIHGQLQTHGIDSVLLSKQDSAYAFSGFPGYQEIHVPESQLAEAQRVLNLVNKDLN